MYDLKTVGNYQIRKGRGQRTPRGPEAAYEIATFDDNPQVIATLWLNKQGWNGMDGSGHQRQAEAIAEALNRPLAPVHDNSHETIEQLYEHQGLPKIIAILAHIASTEVNLVDEASQEWERLAFFSRHLTELKALYDQEIGL